MDIKREAPHHLSTGRVTLTELVVSLKAGFADFTRAPAFGLFFAGVYVAIGLFLVWSRAGAFTWTLVVSLGFPLFAPFAAVGLYEVSRRLEAGAALTWREILGVVLAEKDRQIPWMGAIIVIYVLFWTFLGHMIFALFMGPSALINATTSYDMYVTREGLSMLAFGAAVGAILAFALFSLTVVSLPLLLDKEVDFVTAMLTSLKLVRENLGVMLVWAGIIAALLVVAMVPVFLGLFVVLPVLGHATWHLYRRAIYDEV